MTDIVEAEEKLAQRATSVMSWAKRAIKAENVLDDVTKERDALSAKVERHEQEIAKLREALSHAENKGMELYDENVLLRSKIREAADEIERLRQQLKLAVFADSEECKIINKENERLREALETIAWSGVGTYQTLQAIARAALQKDEIMQSIPQSSNPAQPDGNSASHNAHAPDAPDSQASRKKGT